MLRNDRKWWYTTVSLYIYWSNVTQYWTQYKKKKTKLCEDYEWTHKRQSMPHPYWQAMEHLFWIHRRKNTVRFGECIVILSLFNNKFSTRFRCTQHFILKWALFNISLSQITALHHPCNSSNSHISWYTYPSLFYWYICVRTGLLHSTGAIRGQRCRVGWLTLSHIVSHMAI